MSISLNHTIVWSRDKQVSATFLAELLGTAAPVPFGPFFTVRVDNDVTLDFSDAEEGKIAWQHYAFLVSEKEFDEIFSRIQSRRLTYWADPMHQQPMKITTRDGGRYVYFEDPSGHNMEILTRPYGP
ncbi:MAG TPA: VOC family protein [Burkholderiales bacterium]|nr:VOC family protein [Burkholderiales bacterium]